MRFIIFFIPILLLFSCEEEEDFSEPFYLDENGVTIKAKDWVKPGITGEIDGTTYIAVDDSLLWEYVGNYLEGYRTKDYTLEYPEIKEARQLVTTLVTNMGSLTNSQYKSINWDVDFSSIGSWDVSNVTDMSAFFNTCNCFNPQYVSQIPDLTHWDVSSVTNMSRMFTHIYGGNMFNQDISGWDVSNVTDMSGMFAGNNKFNQDLSNWDVSKVTNCDGFEPFWGTHWTLPKPNFTIDCN
tara:strand:- start:225 stop:941 length:717 start_codon:yes stop_codon:yes gene_type:complete